VGAVIQGWAQDIKARDRDEAKKLASPAETRLRQNIQISRQDQDETFVGHKTSLRR